MKNETKVATALVVTFPSTHQALKCDRTFKSKIEGFQLMPVPRQISSSCGLAARVTGLDWEQLEEQLTAAGIQYDEVYLFASNGKLELLVGQRD
ncbi:MAG TPA: DUF3343 domain-containing protein [Firmicutes bacterium]|nr:DUF3343 domain-containing protein [Bacillota bacterium]